MLQGMGTMDGTQKRKPVVLVGSHEKLVVVTKLTDMVAPWLMDAKAQGPSLQAAVDRYQKVYSDMFRGHTCIEKRKAAMTAALELYISLVAERLYVDDHWLSKTPELPKDQANKGFSVAAAYHQDIAKTYLVEEARLKRVYDEFGSPESLELASIASDHAKKHLSYAGDMLRMALGQKPVEIGDEFGEFTKTLERLLG
jgi:hypothetical protein